MTTPPPPYGTYAPVPPMSPADEKLWATLSHVSGIFFSLVGPLVIYLVVKDRGPFVRAHAASALNLQLTLLIGYLVCIPLAFVFIGLLLLPAVAIFGLIVAILGAVKANSGQWYHPPLTIRFVS
ncbi:DUF4870 domain-containing protein [Microbacterium sp. 179-B 1A2 NHS]|uniref:DUF4870 domain-containing protein n=1 Tax=Microbacterium sp. 179-B 1A2 NHS TaxID=3142383 RepID=UPI0039A03CC5